MPLTRNSLWLRWTAANAPAEMLGLAATFAVIVVGLAKWWAMSPRFPTIRVLHLSTSKRGGS